jgi:hypothetical protein
MLPSSGETASAGWPDAQAARRLRPGVQPSCHGRGRRCGNRLHAVGPDAGIGLSIFRHVQRFAGRRMVRADAGKRKGHQVQRPTLRALLPRRGGGNPRRQLSAQSGVSGTVQVLRAGQFPPCPASRNSAATTSARTSGDCGRSRRGISHSWDATRRLNWAMGATLTNSSIRWIRVADHEARAGGIDRKLPPCDLNAPLLHSWI